MKSEITRLEEEIFCLKFELRTISDVLLFQKAERWVKGFVHQSTERAHLERYEFVTKYVEEKSVLDIACGSGYGSYIIKHNGRADKVVGVDLDENAIRYGNYRYNNDDISRVVADATNFRGSDKFDVIISFETIEHILDYEKLLWNFSENLKDDGVLLISTPISQQTTTQPKNPYHIIEWSFTDFQKLIRNSNFRIKEIYLQNALCRKEKQNEFTTFMKTLFKLFPIKKVELLKEKYTKNQGIQLYEPKPKENIIGGYQIIIAEKIKSPTK